MNKTIFQLLRSFTLLLLLPVALFAGDLPDAPVPERLVNDFAKIFSSREVASLESRLAMFVDSTTTQVVVVTTTSLEDYDISEYAARLAEKWGVGQRGRDNGVMIVVKPKTTFSKGEVFIAVGYGLEGVLPDITAGRIVQEEMIPYFAKGQMYRGVSNAVDVITSITAGEYSAQDWEADKDMVGYITYGFVGLVVLIVLLSSIFGKGRGDGGNTLTGGLFMGPIIMGGSRRGYSSGGSGFGGFGGFGGGGFGGGGAGGSW